MDFTKNEKNQYESTFLQRDDKPHITDIYNDSEGTLTRIASYNAKTDKITFDKASENYLLPEYLRIALGKVKEK